MKTLLTFCLIISSVFVALSQEKFDVKWHNDTVYNNNKALFTCKERVQKNMRMYTMRNFDNKQLVILFFEDHDTISKGSATFPSIGMSYRIYCQKEKANAWLDIYVRNGIISKGEVDSMALVAYCQSKRIPLKNISGRKAKRPGDRDSLATTHSNPKSLSMVAFYVLNQSKQSVTVSIGTAVSNKSQVILPGSKMDLQANDGENICIVDKTKKSSDCRLIKNGVNQITINKNGSGFE